ncbi:hypothetical protein jhhlp_008634 [Lomentospora prolificans]|uniref:Zn(2)-C6 fungal-type domain-containing protein n=1 Tax=Lomentospora prolificans TaxID=41688 RepID=A0A2N3MYK7_9PEZI|nr:hypothetical protein jhhlp_008634 [Lomentospora prolificans]
MASTSPNTTISSPGHPSPASSGQSSQDKPKRNRTSKPKVKTGCNNCKQRRIKCDEQRPHCTQCVKSRKICPGYPAPSRSARSHEVISIAPKPQPLLAAAPPVQPAPVSRPPIPTVPLPPRRAAKQAARKRATATVAESKGPPNETSLTLYRPSTNLSLQDQEGLYFLLFRTHTARELSGFFDSVFWTQTVLRECHSAPAIRHAVVALGALYKTLEQTTASPPGSPSRRLDVISATSSHWQVAVKQYSEAITSVVTLTRQGQESHRVLLMATVLLACFDSFIGDHKQAIYQIQNGLRLLDQLRAQEQHPSMQGVREPIEDELVQMFTRLAIQAKSYDMAFHFPQPYVVRLTPQTPEPQQPTSPRSDSSSSSHSSLNPQATIPAQFGTLLEARRSWDILCESMLRFTETLFLSSNPNGPMGILPRALKRHGLSYKEQLEAWSDAFQSLLEHRSAPSVSYQEKAGIAVLKMFQTMGQVVFLMTFCDSESQFDMYESQFKSIVDLALEVVGDEERRAATTQCPDPSQCTHRSLATDFLSGQEYTAHHVKASFSADLGIVPPLYVVATKCRNHSIRWQAIRLLRSSSRREGMWDSQLSARIGEWVASIEEEEDLSPAARSYPSRRSSSNDSVLPFAGDVALGPGGNARWDYRRDGNSPGPNSRSSKRWVPEDKRVMVRSVDFDLKSRFARLTVGTRGLQPNSVDLRARETTVNW